MNLEGRSFAFSFCELAQSCTLGLFTDLCPNEPHSIKQYTLSSSFFLAALKFAFHQISPSGNCLPTISESRPPTCHL